MTLLPTTSLHHPAESELFDETLSCELALPAEYQAGSALGRTGNAEALLRSLALVEDSRVDEHEERSEATLQLQRLEANEARLLSLGAPNNEGGNQPKRGPYNTNVSQGRHYPLVLSRKIRCLDPFVHDPSFQ